MANGKEQNNFNKIIVIDFGSQYNQLIARRIREYGVYSSLIYYKNALEVIKNTKNVKGIILSGGPKSVYDEDAFKIEDEIFKLGLPILGICYGMQYIAYHNQGTVSKGINKEYGFCKIKVEDSKIFKNTNKEQTVWMSHGDVVSSLGSNYKVVATSSNTKIVAFENDKDLLYGVQFHPEVNNTEFGSTILKNFIFGICKATSDWQMSDYASFLIDSIKNEVQDKKVLLGISGGVDSTVAAVLINKAIGNNLTCMFIDHGLLRKDEASIVMERFKRFNINVKMVDASKTFLDRLSGVSDPEQKRKVIGSTFIEVFDEQAKQIGEYAYLAQGTLYTDIIESGTSTAQTIKSHHNVGGLPSNMPFKLLEPLKELFKDEVRNLGRALNLDDELVNRQPFPGPGLAIRIIGDVTRDKIRIVQDSDYILREEFKKAGLDKEVWQYFTVLTSNKTVGVMGDNRSYSYCVAIRAVTSIDGMTADWARVPYDVLNIVSNRIVNETNNVNRVVYDITSKPPGTIEWE